MKAMREELKAVERLRKAADPTGPAGTGQAPRLGAGAVKGTAFWRPFLGASRFTTPLCTELSTFTHGRRLPYEADYFTRHCPPEYPPAPLPSCSRNRQTRPPARSRRPMPATAAATAAGAGSASMKKSKPEPFPSWTTASTAERGGWYMSAANYDGGNCIALDDGEECVCVQSISYSLLCRWFRAAVLPLDRELETAPVPRLGRQAVRRLWGAVYARLQPGQKLPGMCCSGTPPQRGRTTAEKILPFYAFRG